MPIYEYYCEDCHTIFNFFSRRINTDARPDCPRCGRTLARQMSIFSAIGRAAEPEDDPLSGLDESRMESAFEELAREAEGLDEDDPRQMARIMRRLSEKTGLSLADGVEEALSRLEAGEDPENIEREMGDLLEDEEMLFQQTGRKRRRDVRREPYRDETLYEL